MQEIHDLIKLIDESSIDEFAYETNGTKVSLKKHKGEVISTEPINPPIPQVELPKKAETKTEENESPVNQEDGQSDFDYEIVSPMVGTFYAAPSPDKDNYVQLGDKVKPDTVVSIIEAMKLFNEIEAEVSGEIVEILAEDGELVEYGQPLYRVKA